jgi:hypothetical protein
MARRFTRLSQNDILNPQRHKYQLDRMMTDLETAFSGVDTAIAALAAAVAAQSDATTALANAATVKRDDKITGSTVIPANVLSAADAGSDATITISAHSRRYGDANAISVTGGTLTGAAYSTDYGIYYDDTTASVTAPTYHKTTTLSNALNNYVAGRHCVGFVTTPAAAGAATTGGQTPPASGAVDDTSRNKYNA